MNKNGQKLLSVCIPTYEMGGVGKTLLRHSLDVLATQTFKDFDVVITDNSRNNLIRDLCEEYKGKLDIDYRQNETNVGMAANINRAIKRANGKIIKILFQDDFLYDNESLRKIAENFNPEKDHWLVTACEHTRDGFTFYKTFYPQYSRKIYLGKNTIGSPSVLAIKNDAPPLFDENLSWLVDCDYYKKYYDIFRKPKILNAVTVVIRTGEHQITNTTTEATKERESRYLLKKYGERKPRRIRLDNVTLVSATGLDNTAGAVRALEISMEGIDYHEVVLIAHCKPDNLNKKITFKQCLPSELASQDPKNTDDYSRFMAYYLHKYIDSEFALIVHNNAYVVRPHQWRDVFLEYDYIGAPWPKDVHFAGDGTNVRVGNGGFSLRSRKLLNAPNELELPFTDNGTGFFHEDGIICVYYRNQLENYGLRFAPVEIASLFSREHDCDDSCARPFGFHNNLEAVPKILLIRNLLRSLLKKI